VPLAACDYLVELRNASALSGADVTLWRHADTLWRARTAVAFYERSVDTRSASPRWLSELSRLLYVPGVSGVHLAHRNYILYERER
jgi:hypothetical protein